MEFEQRLAHFQRKFFRVADSRRTRILSLWRVGGLRTPSEAEYIGTRGSERPSELWESWKPPCVLTRDSLMQCNTESAEQVANQQHLVYEADNWVERRTYVTYVCRS